jgi:hypothetical protein
MAALKENHIIDIQYNHFPSALLLTALCSFIIFDNRASREFSGPASGLKSTDLLLGITNSISLIKVFTFWYGSSISSQACVAAANL